MDGLSSTHLGTRFWITTDTEGLKKLNNVDNDPTQKVVFKKITAKSERIFSLAQDGITGRFSNVLNSAKLFGARVQNDYRCRNHDTLKLCLGATTEDAFNQKLNALADKIARINGVGENTERSEIVRLIYVMCDTKDFDAFAQEYTNTNPIVTECENYIASLMNATAGALKLIKEHKLTAGSILELDKGRIYDLSREYDMYEVAYKAYKLVAREVDMPHFDVGDGSAKTLKNKLREIKTKIEGKLTNLQLADNIREALTSTVKSIKCCLNRGFKVRNADKFYSDAHKVLEPLMEKCGKRQVDVKIRASGSFGVLAGLAKVEVAGSYTYSTTIEKTLDGYKLTVNHKGGLEGSLNAKAGFSSGDNVGKDKGERVQGIQAKVGANVDIGGGTSKVYATLDDLIAELGDNAEIVCAGKKSLGILGGIGRVIRGAWRKFWNWKTKDSEFDARKCLADLKKADALNNLDDVISRREVGLKLSSRSSIRISGGVNASISGNIGYSRGEVSEGKYDDVRVLDANISGSGSISWEKGVVSDSYRSITKQMMLLSDEGLRNEVGDDAWVDELNGNDAEWAIGKLNELKKDMLKAEELASRKEEGWAEEFKASWIRLAAKAELLMRKIPTDTQDNEVNARNLEVKSLIVDLLDHPRINDEQVLSDLNKKVSTSTAGTRTLTAHFDLSYDIGGGTNEAIGDQFGISDGIGKTAAEGALKFGAETVKSGIDQISPIPTKAHFGVTGSLTTLTAKNPALPWDGIEVLNMSVNFSPTVTLQKLAEKLFEANSRICAMGKGEKIPQERIAAAKEKFFNDLFSNLGVTVTETALGTPIGMFLKDKSLDPKAAAAFSIGTEVSLTLTYHDGELVSFSKSKDETTSSSIGGEVTIPILGTDVAFGLKCSESITESVSTRFRVGAMPIDSVLANISKYAGLTCREQTISYLNSNKRSAANLFTQVLSSIRNLNNQDNLIDTKCMKRLKDVDTYLNKHTQPDYYLARIKAKFEAARNKLQEWAGEQPFMPNLQELTNAQIKALADYLIAINQVYTFKRDNG